MDLRVGDVRAAPGCGDFGAEPAFGVPPGVPGLPDRAGLQPQPGCQHCADMRQPSQRRAGGGESQVSAITLFPRGLIK